MSARSRMRCTGRMQAVVRDNKEAVTLVSVEIESSRSRAVYTLGDRYPLTLGSPGLAILSCEPPQLGKWLEIANARAAGSVAIPGEVLPNLGTPAAPVTSASGRAVAAVAIAYTVERPGPVQVREVVGAA